MNDALNNVLVDYWKISLVHLVLYSTVEISYEKNVQQIVGRLKLMIQWFLLLTYKAKKITNFKNNSTLDENSWVHIFKVNA